MGVFEVTIDKTVSSTIFVVAESELDAHNRVYAIEGTYLMREIFRGADGGYVGYVGYTLPFTEPSSMDAAKEDADNLILTSDGDLKWAEDVTDEDFE